MSARAQREIQIGSSPGNIAALIFAQYSSNIRVR